LLALVEGTAFTTAFAVTARAATPPAAPAA